MKKGLWIRQTNRDFFHMRHLKLYMRHGIRNEKIHTNYKLKQSPRLAKYIKYKTEQRSKANTELEKFFTK